MKVARHDPASWPPEPGFFRIRFVRGGPDVPAAIEHGMGFWGATIAGARRERHADPAKAPSVPEIWERGTRIDLAEYTALLRDPDPAPRTPIDVGALPPISFGEPAMSASNVVPLRRNIPTVDLAAALEPETLTAWIAAQLAPFTDRAAQLRAAFDRSTTVIANDDVAAKATDFKRQVRDAINETDAERVRIKAPVLAAQRAIDGAAKVITDPLMTVSAECDRRITAFLVEKDRAIRAAAAEEAARRQAEAAALIDEATVTGDLDAVDRAAEAETEQFRAEAIVSAPTVELTRLHTANRGVASLRDNWVYEIQDIAKVPAHFLMINDAAVKAAIKGGSRNIPGLIIRNQPKVGVR